MYFIFCIFFFLLLITVGRGVRECVAKRAAADELYRQYCQETKTVLKVDIPNALFYRNSA